MNKKTKLILQLFVLGMCWAVIYSLAFIQYLLYDPLKEALGCSNAQLGLLMTIFGLGNIFGAPIGGWLADRFDYKKLFSLSLLFNGILSFIFAINLNYSFAIIIWIGLALAALVMNYPSHIKIVRMLADDENQGKIFGFNEAFVGVGSIIINAVFLYIFGKFVGATVGMRGVVIAIGVVSIICSVVSWFILKDVGTRSDESDEVEEKLSSKDFFIVLKSPETWMLGIGIFAVYSFAVTMSYFTPYMTAVLGGTVALSGVLSIIRIHGLRLVGAPFGGWLSDKIKSVSKVLIIVYVVGIMTLVLFMKLPYNTSITIFVFLTFVVGFVVYMGKGSYYAVSSELNIPRKYSATTVGIAAALGFSPDVFLFALAGHWLDTYGNKGYTYLFTFQLVILVIGILGSMMVLRYKKKKDINTVNAN
ncbi:MFS transporter [Clostridioides difficile]|uniref:MFS transporter n=1 Tax=Clostridioides difficile TaxID=1496 RepID=UPI000C9BB64D|nr:MFS transporter [Clostridioides difficile]MBH6948908.1 MFS transporter [Clostridioides difficile]MDI3072985.1 MFS transporter [Clostridioides difficile]MDK3167358.1 MFS transporter [Clostridioides difficile]NMU15907.1 MFS transporter [Clostridioides difficile]